MDSAFNIAIKLIILGLAPWVLYSISITKDEYFFNKSILGSSSFFSSILAIAIFVLQYNGRPDDIQFCYGLIILILIISIISYFIALCWVWLVRSKNLNLNNYNKELNQFFDAKENGLHTDQVTKRIKDINSALACFNGSVYVMTFSTILFFCSLALLFAKNSVQQNYLNTTGLVIDNTGRPIQSAEVKIFANDKLSNLLGHYHTDKSGCFQLNINIELAEKIKNWQIIAIDCDTLINTIGLPLKTDTVYFELKRK